MDKTVAEELRQYAARRQQQEFVKWNGMPPRTPEKQVEAQRMRVGAWATAANWLYQEANKQEQAVS